jgi:hypothetical protein
VPARGGPISRAAKVLSISLALPEPTEEERMYKKGGRWLCTVRRPSQLCALPALTFSVFAESETLSIPLNSTVASADHSAPSSGLYSSH